MGINCMSLAVWLGEDKWIRPVDVVHVETISRDNVFTIIILFCSLDFKQHYDYVNLH